MKKRNENTILSLEREDMTDNDKRLFVEDLKVLLNEYFERDGAVTVDITRIREGFSVCVIFSARRMKKPKRLP
jgi:hypothetical protein